MSTLVCLVRQRLPVALVTLAGTLDDLSVINTGLVLRECLAAQPIALIIEATHLQIEGSRTGAWLDQVGADAQRWPGVPVLVCGLAVAQSHTGALRFTTVEAAMRAATRLPVSPRIERDLAADSGSCATARQVTRAACTAWGLARYARLGELLASELVGNAVVHAGTGISLTVRAHDGLEISVTDGDPRQVRLGGTDARGFGLELVDALSDTWGCLPTATGKVVWARVGGTESGRSTSPYQDMRVKSD